MRVALNTLTLFVFVLCLVSNFVCITGLSILSCPIRFSQTFILISTFVLLSLGRYLWWWTVGFLFRSEFFFRTTRELEYLFFSQNLTLGYMTKTLNQIIFFFLHQNQNIFFSNIGNQNIFLEKTHNPPPPPFNLSVLLILLVVCVAHLVSCLCCSSC